jgi:hypothetical protein
MIEGAAMSSYLTRLDGHAGCLGEMMQRCGVDPVALARQQAGLTMMSVARACMRCRHGEACRLWLDAADRQGVSRPPDFCPNAERFRTVLTA